MEPCTASPGQPVLKAFKPNAFEHSSRMDTTDLRRASVRHLWEVLCMSSVCQMKDPVLLGKAGNLASGEHRSHKVQRAVWFVAEGTLITGPVP